MADTGSAIDTAVVSVRQKKPFPSRAISFERVLLRRSAVLAIILLNTVAVAVTVIVPQRMRTSAGELSAWQQAHPQLAPILQRVGLDQVLTTPWFGVLLGLFLLCLVLSLPRQVATAWRRRSDRFSEEERSDRAWTAISVRPEALRQTLRCHGFRRLVEGTNGWRYGRHTLGWWGNPLFHLGLAMIVAAALAIALTGQRGVLHLTPRETHRPGDSWFATERGLLARPLELPGTIALDYILPEFWTERGELRRLSSGVRLEPSAGTERRMILDVSAPQEVMGYRLYLGSDFGHAFFLTVALPDGRLRPVRWDLPYPPHVDGAGYGNFQLDGVPYRIKAKYQVNRSPNRWEEAWSHLALRLVDAQGLVVAECLLQPGERGMLGPYPIALGRVLPWASIIVSRQYGIGLIFCGFFVVVVGSGLIYGFPPREVLVRRQGEAFSLSFRSGRFSSLYRSEYERLLDDLRSWKP